MKENERINCSKKHAKESSLCGGEMKPEGNLETSGMKKEQQ